MKSTAAIAGMKSIADRTPSDGSTGANGVRSTPRDLGGVLGQGLTLLRIAAVVLVLYVKFKFLGWIHRRRGDGRRE